MIERSNGPLDCGSGMLEGLATTDDLDCSETRIEEEIGEIERCGTAVSRVPEIDDKPVDWGVACGVIFSGEELLS